MKKNVFHKLLVILCVLLSLTLLVCSCGEETPDPTPNPDNNPGNNTDPTETYTVTVTDGSNAPIEGATVELFSGKTSKGTATTNASGVATFEVAEGVYTAKVSKDGFVAEEDTYYFLDGAKSLTAKMGADTTATYKVTVVNWKGEPLEGIQVQLCTDAGCQLPTATDANGVVILSIERDNYTVKLPLVTEYAVAEYYEFDEGSTELEISLNPLFFDEPAGNSLTVGAGKTLYFSFRAEGATMNLLGDNVTVVHNEQTYQSVDGMVTITQCVSDGYSPAIFAVTNNGTASATYTINFLYPVGYMQNPAELVIGSNSITTKENYYYTYTATVAGTFTLTIDEACTDWSYTIHNLTTETYGSIRSSNDDPMTPSQTVSVAAGDTLQVIIAAAGISEATVTFTAAFEAAA